MAIRAPDGANKCVLQTQHCWASSLIGASFQDQLSYRGNKTMNVWLMLLLSEHEDQRSSWMVEGSELGSGSLPESKDGIPLPPTKPRIWSMAELAVSKSSYVGCGWEAKKEEALPKSAPLSLSFPSLGSPSKAQTRPDPAPQHSDHSSVKSELSPAATEDKNFYIVRLNIRGWHSQRITFVT